MLTRAVARGPDRTRRARPEGSLGPRSKPGRSFRSVQPAGRRRWPLPAVSISSHWASLNSPFASSVAYSSSSSRRSIAAARSRIRRCTTARSGAFESARSFDAALRGGTVAIGTTASEALSRRRSAGDEPGGEHRLRYCPPRDHDLEGSRAVVAGRESTRRCPPVRSYADEFRSAVPALDRPNRSRSAEKSL